MKFWILLVGLAFANAVYLSGDQLSGYEIFTIVFHRDESAAIPYLEYHGVMLPKIRQQLHNLISTLFMDDESWVMMWKRWRKSHEEISEKYWDEDVDKYLVFAKLIYNLDGRKTFHELEAFDWLLLSVPKDPLYLSIKTEMITLLTFMFVFVTAKLSLWSYFLVANPRTLLYLLLEILIHQVNQP
jgi:hypothetical protein